jgi:drug/metabolite transporter (DMT)-like permease
VAWTLLVGTLVSLPLAVLDWRPPDLFQWAILLCLGISFGLGQHLLTKAFSLAPANVLTPFSYFQILSAAIFGLLVFHSFPDAWTILGMVLIVGSGGYVFGRKRPSGS